MRRLIGYNYVMRQKGCDSWTRFVFSDRTEIIVPAYINPEKIEQYTKAKGWQGKDR